MRTTNRAGRLLVGFTFDADGRVLAATALNASRTTAELRRRMAILRAAPEMFALLDRRGCEPDCASMLPITNDEGKCNCPTGALLAKVRGKRDGHPLADASEAREGPMGVQPDVVLSDAQLEALGRKQ